MKKVLKWCGVILSIFVVIVLGGVGYLKFMLPNVGEAPELKVEATPERLARELIWLIR